MTDSTIKGMPIAQRIYLHTELLAHGILPSCLNCVFRLPPKSPFATGPVFCDQYKAVPPLDVIVKGCVGWDQDIPF